jgi:rRNA maturation protein Nop10
MSRVTVRQTLKRLQAQYFIFKVGHDQTSRATLWRFGGDMLNKGKRFSQTDPLTSLPRGGDPNGSVLYKSDGSGTDAAERGALNATGMRVFEAMRRLGRPARAKVIRAEAKVSLGQVYGSLRKLRNFGLVKHPKRNSWKLSKRAAKLDDLKALDELVAKPAGKLGKGQRRAQRFAVERASHAAQTILEWRAKHDTHFRLRSTKCPHCGHVVWHHRSLVLGQCPRCGEALVAETPQRRARFTWSARCRRKLAYHCEYD